uniref:Niemann-Pick C1 protein n=1 Tax=Nippostrongylus brasiliensis TaxID=27835 RepID=A0A0N4YRS0_NIPBR
LKFDLQIWNNLPVHVKNEYGEQFKENFKVAWQTGVNIVANPNLDWVVDSYVHALFGFWPRMRSSSPLLEKFLGFFGKAGHVSLLSVVVGAVYLKSLFLYVTTGAARTANHTLAAE